jgi:hypothetical protein
MTLAGNPSVPLIATHLVALQLIVVGPILDYFQTGALRRNPNSQRRLRYYRFTFGFGQRPPWRVGRKASDISRPCAV